MISSKPPHGIAGYGPETLAIELPRKPRLTHRARPNRELARGVMVELRYEAVGAVRRALADAARTDESPADRVYDVSSAARDSPP